MDIHIWCVRTQLKGGGKYYGAFPKGFLEKARALMGVGPHDPVLHVCSGRVKDYPYERGFGPNDRTLDLDPILEPDFLRDAREPFPLFPSQPEKRLWPAIMIDPPYSEADAEHYKPGPDRLPSPQLLLKNGLNAVRPGGRVGVLHYFPPRPPAGMEGVRFLFNMKVDLGYCNRTRTFSVFEKAWE